MLKFRTADFYRTKTPQDRLFYSAGIPLAFWKPFDGSPSFKPVANDPNTIKSQSKQYNKLISDAFILNDPYLVFIGSEDETSALLLAYTLLKSALVVNKLVQITDASLIQDEEKKLDASVCMLHNVFEDSTNERRMQIKDWVNRHHDCFRVVTVAGDPEIVAKSCRLPVDIMLNVGNVTNSVTKNLG